jgi:hypothetical protein
VMKKNNKSETINVQHFGPINKLHFKNKKKKKKLFVFYYPRK